jgi:hypothetical protein
LRSRPFAELSDEFLAEARFAASADCVCKGGSPPADMPKAQAHAFAIYRPAVAIEPHASLRCVLRYIRGNPRSAWTGVDVLRIE